MKRLKTGHARTCDEELSSVQEGANFGLGRGNPVALASLMKGETVLDMGSGPGFDCFLSANKNRIFKEAYRVLRSGGRLMVSDIVMNKELPDALKKSVEEYISCLSGAISKDEYLNAIKNAGFRDVRIVDVGVLKNKI